LWTQSQKGKLASTWVGSAPRYAQLSICLNYQVFFAQVLINLECLVFLFQYELVDPADVSSIVTTLKRAINVIGTAVYKEMIQNCMAKDLSWKVIHHLNEKKEI
jgi:hypothetical protein